MKLLMFLYLLIYLNSRFETPIPSYGYGFHALLGANLFIYIGLVIGIVGLPAMGQYTWTLDSVR